MSLRQYKSIMLCLDLDYEVMKRIKMLNSMHDIELVLKGSDIKLRINAYEENWLTFDTKDFDNTSLKVLRELLLIHQQQVYQEKGKL